MDLANQQCIPCRSGTAPLEGDELAALQQHLNAGWEVAAHHHLVKTFLFADFVCALAFVNQVGAMAEEQNHHPDIHLAWGKARIEIWTHTIDGLTPSDFVFAAKCEKLAEPD